MEPHAAVVRLAGAYIDLAQRVGPWRQFLDWECTHSMVCVNNLPQYVFHLRPQTVMMEVDHSPISWTKV